MPDSLNILAIMLNYAHALNEDSTEHCRISFSQPGQKMDARFEALTEGLLIAASAVCLGDFN